MCPSSDVVRKERALFRPPATEFLFSLGFFLLFLHVIAQKNEQSVIRMRHKHVKNTRASKHTNKQTKRCSSHQPTRTRALSRPNSRRPLPLLHRVDIFERRRRRTNLRIGVARETMMMRSAGKSPARR